MSYCLAKERLPFWVEPNLPFLVSASRGVLLLDFYHWRHDRPGEPEPTMVRLSFERLLEYTISRVNEPFVGPAPRDDEPGVYIFELRNTALLARASRLGQRDVTHWTLSVGDQRIDVYSGMWRMRELDELQSAESRARLEQLRAGAS